MHLHTQSPCIPYFHQLHEIFKVLFHVDGELAVLVDDVVVLHLALTAHTQRVVPGEVGALSYQEQPCLRWGQQLLRLLSTDLPMEPSRTGG